MASGHGTRRRYLEGCRCDGCRTANSAYERDRRRRHAAGEAVQQHVISSLPAETPECSGPGHVEVGVQAELAGLSSAQLRPGLVEQALELARVMDNPRAVSSKAPTSRQLTDILNQLRKGADKKQSNLASVRQLSRDQASA